MTAFSTFLDSIYRDGNDVKAFEHFVKWFLTHVPDWSTQVDKVGCEMNGPVVGGLTKA